MLSENGVGRALRSWIRIRREWRVLDGFGRVRRSLEEIGRLHCISGIGVRDSGFENIVSGMIEGIILVSFVEILVKLSE